MITHIVEHAPRNRHRVTRFSQVKYLSFTTVHLETCRGLLNVMTRPHFRAEELIPLILQVLRADAENCPQLEKAAAPKVMRLPRAATLSGHDQWIQPVLLESSLWGWPGLLLRLHHSSTSPSARSQILPFPSIGVDLERQDGYCT